MRVRTTLPRHCRPLHPRKLMIYEPNQPLKHSHEPLCSAHLTLVCLYVHHRWTTDMVGDKPPEKRRKLLLGSHPWQRLDPRGHHTCGLATKATRQLWLGSGLIKQDSDREEAALRKEPDRHLDSKFAKHRGGPPK